MNTVAKGLAWTGLVAGLVGSAIYANQEYNRYQLDKFCREIDAADTSGTVISRAKSQRLLVRDFDQVIYIGGYQYACRIEINGQIILRTGISR